MQRIEERSEVGARMPGRHDRPTFTPADLLLIDGLDRVTAERMVALGLTGFAEMSAWTAADVAQWRDRLGLDKRITSGCWIEQAALLASGHETAYARRVRLGETAALVRSPPASKPRPVPAVSQPDAAPSESPENTSGPAPSEQGSLMLRLTRLVPPRSPRPRVRRAAYLFPVEEAEVEIVIRTPASSSSHRA